MSRDHVDIIDKRVEVWSQMAVDFSRYLPPDLRYLAFTSPLGTRDPEKEMLLHPGFIRKGGLHNFIYKTPGLLRAFVTPLYRLLKGKRLTITLVDRGAGRPLAVAPAVVARAAGPDEVSTAYCTAEDSRHCSWLIFETQTPASGASESTSLDVAEIFGILRHLTGAFIRLVSSLPGSSSHHFSGLILLLTWIASQDWVCLIRLRKSLRQQISRLKPSRVFCVHEFHPHSKALWSLCREMGVRTTTVLHSPMAEGKLWLYPTRQEMDSGLCYPDHCSVYCSADLKKSREIYTKNIRLSLSCGPRYSHWIGVPQEHHSSGETILFVGSLSEWDMAVVLAGIERLLEGDPKGGNRKKLVFRKHPTAVLTRKQQGQLRNLVSQGQLLLSEASLREDLNSAGVVVGFGSTILEECLACGCCPVAIVSEDYISFASRSIRRVTLQNLSFSELDRIRKDFLDNRDRWLETGRKALGLNHPVYSVQSAFHPD